MPNINRASFDFARFDKPQSKITSQRQAELKLFCDRMPTLSPGLIACKMAHIKTEDLHETYEAINKNARNFTALWRWHFMPKKLERS